MGTVVVVVVAPVGDDGLGFEEAGELLDGEAFVAQPRVERFDSCVLLGRSRVDGARARA